MEGNLEKEGIYEVMEKGNLKNWEDLDWLRCWRIDGEIGFGGRIVFKE